MGRPPSVRTQLLVLELGIAVPLLGLITLLLLEFRSNEERQARDSTAQLGRLAAANLQTFVHDLDATLESLALRARIRAADPGRCDPIFQDGLALTSGATDLLLLGPGNRALCAADARTLVQPLASEIEACAAEVWRTRRPATSQTFLDPRAHRWTLARAHPVEREGRMVAVLATTVDLARFQAAVSRVELPAEASLIVLDRQGDPVSGFIVDGKASIRPRAGKEENRLRQRRDQALAVSAVPDLGWNVVTHMPFSVAKREHGERVIELGTLAIIALTLATGLALFVSAEIARPIQALSAATRRAAAGDLDVRAPIEGSSEAAEVTRAFNAMVAARAEVEEALRQSAVRLRLAVQVAHVGLWELDLRSGEAFYSPEWKAQLGYAGVELGHRPMLWRQWLHPEDLSRVVEREDAFLADPKGHLMAEFRLRHRDDSYRWFLSRTEAIRDGEKQPLRLVGCHVDVTALRGHHEMERRLQDRLRRAEQMSAMGALVAGVAHEVRNPLFGITATVDALEARAGLEGPYAPYLNVLREQASRLARLMSDLLEYGRPHEPHHETMAPGQPLDDACRQCAAAALERGVMIVRRAENSTPIALDLDRVSRALRNMIENALQFSPAGEAVSIEVREAHDERGDWLIYQVSDRGPGFREEDLAQVVEPFFSRRRGGTGLGLPIARRIAEEHGGRLRISNHPSGGGMVTLELPISSAAQVVS